MSNIQKAFKNKAKMGLRMASGGFVSSIPDALPTSMFSGPGGGVGTTYSGMSSPLRQNQRMSGAGDSGGGLGLAAARPVGQERRDSPLRTMDNRIAQGAALEGLSNTERYQLSNPGNQAYGVGGPAPGSSAEASQMGRTNDIMRTLRSNLAQQPEMMADGGVVGVLRNRKNAIDSAVDNATGNNAPAPKPAAPAAPTGEAADYAAQAAAIEAEQLAAARKAAMPAPKKGLMSRLGFAKSGVVKGEGTRTSDSVPATVGEGSDKQKLALSDGEGLLVVSNNTMDNPEAMDQIRQILAASNDGKEPVMPDQGLRRGVQKAKDSAVLPGLSYPDDLNLRDPRTIPQQDGLRTGTPRQPEMPRPDWINRGTQVAEYRGPIESTATRLPDPGTSVVPQTPVNSHLNERVGSTGPAQAVPKAEPYKPNWTPGSKGGAVVPYSAQPDLTAEAANAANTEARAAASATYRKTLADASKLPGQVPLENAARFVGDKAGKVVNTAKAVGTALVESPFNPVLKAALPVVDAVRSNYGDGKITVDDTRNPNLGLGRQMLGAGKETALRFGDWGTKLADDVLSPFTAVTNVGSRTLGNGSKVSYTKWNDAYRKMVDGDGVNAPQNGEVRGTHIMSPEEVANMKVVAKSKPFPSRETPSVERQAGRGPIGSEYANPLDPRQLNARLDDSFTADADQTRNLRSGFISNMADDPNIKRGTSRVDATQMRAPEGGGYVTGQPDANGLRRSIAVMPSETRWEDGQQYKDAIAQNEKDKITLRGMQHDRIKRTAAMPGATDGDRLAYAGQIKDNENEATAAKNLNDIAMRNAELGLRREEFGMINANRAADNERADAAARTASAEKVQGHMSKLLDRYVPTEGLKDDDLVAAQAKRSRIEQAMLANYGGQMPTDLATFEKNAATMLHQARLTEALNQAVKNRGVVDKVRNLASGNRRPTVSQDPMHPISEQDGLTIDYGGIPLFANDVFNGDADLISAYKQRVKDQAGAKTKKAASNK